MTDNKLTLQDCFKYPEAPLISQLGLKCGNLTEFIKAIDGHDLEFILQDDDFKLILRPIEQLTDEDKEIILNEYAFEIYEDATEMDDFVWQSFDEILAICENKVGVIDYLREKNIMVEKSDWFAIGKAVKG